jgi:hypothetical protein
MLLLPPRESAVAQPRAIGDLSYNLQSKHEIAVRGSRAVAPARFRLNAPSQVQLAHDLWGGTSVTPFSQRWYLFVWFESNLGALTGPQGLRQFRRSPKYRGLRANWQSKVTRFELIIRARATGYVLDFIWSETCLLILHVGSCIQLFPVVHRRLKSSRPAAFACAVRA